MLMRSVIPILHFVSRCSVHCQEQCISIPSIHVTVYSARQHTQTQQKEPALLFGAYRLANYVCFLIHFDVYRIYACSNTFTICHEFPPSALSLSVTEVASKMQSIFSIELKTRNRPSTTRRPVPSKTSWPARKRYPWRT